MCTISISVRRPTQIYPLPSARRSPFISSEHHERNPLHLRPGSDAIGFRLLHHLPRLHLLVDHLIQLPLLRHLPHLPLLLQELLLLLRRQVLQQRHINPLRDTPMKRPNHTIHVINRQLPDIGHGLHFGGALLELLVRHVDVQLHGAALDGVPTRQARGEMHVAREAEVGGVDDLVGGRVVEDGLGVDAGLVGEGAEAGDRVVERDVDRDGLRDEVLDVFEFGEFVFGHDVVAVYGDHARHEAAEGGDAVSFLGWGVSWGGSLGWGVGRTPMPRTDVSTWVAPASRAQ